MAKHEISPKCPKCQEMLYAGLADPVMRQWFEDLQVQRPEVHIAYVYRNKDDQDKFFREGKSKAKFGLSPHNYMPCLAIDIFFLVNGQYYLDESWLKNIASNLPDGIEWGGNFPKFPDGPHFQRIGWIKMAKSYPNGDKP